MIFSDSQDRLRVIDCDLGANSCRRAIDERLAQMRHQLGALEDDEAVVKRVAFVGFGKATGDNAPNRLELQRGGGLLATRARAEMESGEHDVASVVEGIAVGVVILNCAGGHWLG